MQIHSQCILISHSLLTSHWIPTSTFPLFPSLLFLDFIFSYIYICIDEQNVQPLLLTNIRSFLFCSIISHYLYFFHVLVTCSDTRGGGVLCSGITPGGMWGSDTCKANALSIALLLWSLFFIISYSQPEVNTHIGR